MSDIKREILLHWASMAIVSGDPDVADQYAQDTFGEDWFIHQDHVWDEVSDPEHRAKKYAEQAIADSKLPEVC
jgi:hypothetical protein